MKHTASKKKTDGRAIWVIKRGSAELSIGLSDQRLFQREKVNDKTRQKMTGAFPTEWLY